MTIIDLISSSCGTCGTSRETIVWPVSVWSLKTEQKEPDMAPVFRIVRFSTFHRLPIISKK